MEFPQTMLLLTAQPDELALVMEVVAAAGGTARISVNPFQLATSFAAHPTEVVILDIEHFPHGIPDLIASLREQNPRVAIILLFAPDQRDLAGAAFCKGADILLLKPASCAEIVAAVNKLTQRHVHDASQAASTTAPSALAPDALMRFALGVAHEINNPLTTISGWLQMLIADSAGDPKLAEMLKSANEEADRIAEVVRQLLTVAQQSPPRADQVQLGKFFDELKRFHDYKHKTDGIAIQIDLDSDIAPISGDGAQLRLACDTLLAESCASLNGSGSIRLTCRQNGEDVEITCHDNGPPLSEEQITHLFEPFQFGRIETGAGLGLCLAQSIIRSHGGTLTVTSSKNKGTDYVIRLPAAKS